MIKATVVYAISEFFCAIIMFGLNASLKAVTNYGKREKWLSRVFITQGMYLLGDGLSTVIPGRYVPVAGPLMILLNLYKALMLDVVSVAIFFYIDSCGQLTMSDTKKKRWLVCLPAILAAVFEVLVSIASPTLFMSVNMKLTSLLDCLLVGVPAFYALVTVALAVHGASQSPTKTVRNLYLVTGTYPLVMVFFGALDIYFGEIPFYAFAATLCLIFLYLYQFGVFVDTLSLSSLSNLKGRERFKSFLEDIQKKGEMGEYYILLIDMDGLKSINDIYGREEGDRAVYLVGEKVEALEESALGASCHYGGDEFLAVLRLADENAVALTIDNLKSAIKQSALAEKMATIPQVVVGFVRANTADGDLKMQLRIAESQIYEQKREFKKGGQEGNFFVDKVTGLPNANYFNSFAGNYVRDHIYDKPAVVLVNIRGMQAYNNRYGYEQGDALLKRIAQELHKRFAKGILVRFAEDNFVIVTADPDVERLLTEAAAEINHKEAVGLRAGIYYCESDQDSVAIAVDKAKLAMRYIKDDRSVVYRVYDQEVSKSFERQAYVLEHFQEALDSGWIRPYYQIDVRSLTGAVCSAEALARWDDPKYGVLTPFFFVETLEAAHLVHKLDLEIIRQVCEMLARRLKERQTVVPISVNLSRVDFQVCDIFAEVDQLRRHYGLEAKMLKIEILESTIATNPKELKRAIGKFHEAGYEVWMDDFGSGYSNFNNLDEYNFDLLKIDMVFLRSFDVRSHIKTILSMIVDMAKKMGMHTVCEGVETQEQADFLREIGCERLQGYLLSKPVPQEEFESQLTHYVQTDVEDPAENDYYDCLSHVNVLFDPMIDSGQKQDPGIKLPIGLIEREGDELDFVFMNHSYQQVLVDNGYHPDQWSQEAGSNRLFQSVMLKLMDESKAANGAEASQVYVFNGISYLLEIRYLATDQLKQKQAYVYTFEKL